MRSMLFWSVAFVCSASALALSQDPVKIEPKHYKLSFENERVRVIAVSYGPHEKSALHDHLGGVGVSITEAHLRFTDDNGKVREVFSKAGEARWYPPFKHRVENLGDTTYEGVYIEVKGKPGMASNMPVDPATAIGEESRKIVAAYLLAAGKP
jgi:quercetin dioxygenase-like cupin family protein